MTILFKEGILYKNEKIWKSDEPYYLSLAYGDWAPSTVKASKVYGTEILDVRLQLEPEDIYLGWNEASDRDEVIITKVFTPTTDLNFNRVFVKVGGSMRAKFGVDFGMYNTIKFKSSNEFVVGDRLEYNNSLYEISAIDVDTNAASLFPINNAPYIPSSGTGTVRDANGYLLIASILDNNYLFAKDEEVSIRLYGTTS